MTERVSMPAGRMGGAFTRGFVRDFASHSTDAVGAQPGVVYLVGGGPGDPGLLTLRGAELLATADVVLHDELVHPSLLERAREGAEVRCVGKRGGEPSTKQASQAAIEATLIAEAR